MTTGTHDIEGLVAMAPILLLAFLLAYLSIQKGGNKIDSHIGYGDTENGCAMILLTILALPAFLLLLVGLAVGILAAWPYF